MSNKNNVVCSSWENEVEQWDRDHINGDNTSNPKHIQDALDRMYDKHGYYQVLHPEFVEKFKKLEGQKIELVSCKKQDGYSCFEIAVENQSLCFEIADASKKGGRCFLTSLNRL